MTANFLTIEAKHRQFFGIPASLADFKTRESDSVDPSIILASPNISLYCFDEATRRAIFVELPLETDLSKAPFVYQMQYEQAQCLIAVPYETFLQIAHTLPPVQNLILIFGSGRGGSTLLNHILNTLDNVVSLAEPDAANQFAQMRNVGNLSDVELRELLDATLRLLFRPTRFKSPTVYALKFRAEAALMMDLYRAAFPYAKNLYLYRDAIGFVRSAYRLAKRAGLPEFAPASAYKAPFTYTQTLPTDYLDPNSEQLSLPQQATMWWIGFIEMYLAQIAKDIPVLAVRYMDLNASREQVLGDIFDYCDLPKTYLTETLTAFEHDSQAGTELARENPAQGNTLQLTDDEYRQVTQILERHPIIKTPDYVAPGTLVIE